MLKQFFTRVFSLDASTQQIQFSLMPLAKKAQENVLYTANPPTPPEYSLRIVDMENEQGGKQSSEGGGGSSVYSISSSWRIYIQCVGALHEMTRNFKHERFYPISVQHQSSTQPTPLLSHNHHFSLYNIYVCVCVCVHVDFHWIIVLQHWRHNTKYCLKHIGGEDF